MSKWGSYILTAGHCGPNGTTWYQGYINSGEMGVAGSRQFSTNSIDAELLAPGEGASYGTGVWLSGGGMTPPGLTADTRFSSTTRLGWRQPSISAPQRSLVGKCVHFTSLPSSRSPSRSQQQGAHRNAGPRRGGRHRPHRRHPGIYTDPDPPTCTTRQRNSAAEGEGGEPDRRRRCLCDHVPKKGGCPLAAGLSSRPTSVAEVTLPRPGLCR